MPRHRGAAFAHTSRPVRRGAPATRHDRAEPAQREASPAHSSVAHATAKSTANGTGQGDNVTTTRRSHLTRPTDTNTLTSRFAESCRSAPNQYLIRDEGIVRSIRRGPTPDVRNTERRCWLMPYATMTRVTVAANRDWMDYLLFWVQLASLVGTAAAALLAYLSIRQAGRQAREAQQALIRERQLDFEIDVLRDPRRRGRA